MAKNIDMLKRIKEQWDLFPESAYMSTWGMDEEDMAKEVEYFEAEGAPMSYYDPNTEDYVPYTKEQCGTTRCLAGWAIHFEAMDRGVDMVNTPLEEAARLLDPATPSEYTDWEGIGAKILGLNESETAVFWYEEKAAYNKIVRWIKNG